MDVDVDIYIYRSLVRRRLALVDLGSPTRSGLCDPDAPTTTTNGYDGTLPIFVPDFHLDIFYLETLILSDVWLWIDIATSWMIGYSERA